jgi:hypothetical protein
MVGGGVGNRGAFCGLLLIGVRTGVEFRAFISAGLEVVEKWALLL